jgi:hypothetical protein
MEGMSMSNLHQIGTAAHMYRKRPGGAWPACLEGLAEQRILDGMAWIGPLAKTKEAPARQKPAAASQPAEN